MRLSLKPHAETPCKALSGIEVQLVRHPNGGLDLHYFALGRVDDVRWPAPAEPERADRLWETTCFEAFLRVPGREAYHEFNFAPSTAWAAYRFTGYRAGMQITTGVAAPEARTRMTAKTRVHHVRLSLPSVPGLAADAAWQVALSAVIEEVDGSKSFWALRHPAGKPDFHHPDCFQLRLPAPEGP
jgi:hypothetical protein